MEKKQATPYICCTSMKRLICTYFEVIVEIPSLCVMECFPLAMLKTVNLAAYVVGEISHVLV